MDPSNAGSSSSGPSSRWNPTKEQLSLLESLYEQGIRTPSAEQIQSITKRLQAYGHIEGKNVFYWFQNHKARQRQKQKMDQQQMMMSGAVSSNNAHNNVVAANNLNNIIVDNAAAADGPNYFNRFYYHSPPVSPSVAAAAAGCALPLLLGPHSSVAYSPYHIARPEFGFYPHCPKIVLPNHIPPNINSTPMSPHPRHEFHRNSSSLLVSQHNAAAITEVNNGSVAYPSSAFEQATAITMTTTTLDLFPVYPTGILQQRDARSTGVVSSMEDDVLIEGSDDQDRSWAIQTSSSPASGVRFDVFSKLRD